MDASSHEARADFTHYGAELRPVRSANARFSRYAGAMLENTPQTIALWVFAALFIGAGVFSYRFR